jgi:hypothetical protein
LRTAQNFAQFIRHQWKRSSLTSWLCCSEMNENVRTHVQLQILQ